MTTTDIRVEQDRWSHNVFAGDTCLGVVIDEGGPDGASQPRGRFAAWTSTTIRTSFHATLDDAVAAIVATHTST